VAQRFLRKDRKEILFGIKKIFQNKFPFALLRVKQNFKEKSKKS